MLKWKLRSAIFECQCFSWESSQKTNGPKIRYIETIKDRTKLVFSKNKSQKLQFIANRFFVFKMDERMWFCLFFLQNTWRISNLCSSYSICFVYINKISKVNVSNTTCGSVNIYITYTGAREQTFSRGVGISMKFFLKIFLLYESPIPGGPLGPTPLNI